MASRAATWYASEKLGWLNGKVASASIVMSVLIASCARWISAPFENEEPNLHNYGKINLEVIEACREQIQ